MESSSLSTQADESTEQNAKKAVQRRRNKVAVVIVVVADRLPDRGDFCRAAVVQPLLNEATRKKGLRENKG